MTERLGTLKCIPMTNPELICVVARSFVQAWQSSMKLHEVMADNRIRFAQRLNEMSDELASLAKEVDKNRKQVCFPRPSHQEHASDLNIDQGVGKPV